MLNYLDEKKQRKTISKSTGLPVKGNKKRAEAMLMEARMELQEELERCRGEADYPELVDPIPFTKFLVEWLDIMESSVEASAYAVYSFGIKNKIVPYFDKRYPRLRLKDVTPKHIQDYYTYEMKVNGVSANTVIHRHANIRKALQYAFKTGLLDANPADRTLNVREKKSSSAASTMNMNWNSFLR